MRSIFGLLALIALEQACGGKSRQTSSDTHANGAAATTPSAAAQTSVGKPPCPATGRWSECAVFNGLDRAGLAPRRDSAVGAVSNPPLTQSGTRYLIGNAELDVFIYPDEGAREREEQRLDRSKFIEATDEPSLRGEATVIRNANLLAILRSRNDHQRERVADALTAGPPQPGHGSSLPATHAPK
jgi:hypothetical protein